MGLVTFLTRLMFTRRFWFLVSTVVIGGMAMSAKTYYRNEVFQAAAETVGKRYTP